MNRPTVVACNESRLGSIIMAVTALGQDGVDQWSLRTGALEVRLARTEAEIAAAQALRYRIFYGEMAARPTPEMAALERDFDRFDQPADHLLVLDHAQSGVADGARVVGTYRLLRREVARVFGSFYTESEYEISALDKVAGEVLELGRSCVDVEFRNGSTMQLLWRGIAAYVFEHGIELMFGCASFPGVDQEKLALPLSYLHHERLAPEEMRPVALPDLYTPMNRIDRDAVNPREALAQVPPLIKGYLRLGGYVGDGAVIDHQFQTTDVCVVVETDRVTRKYFDYYEKRERRPVLAYEAP